MDNIVEALKRWWSKYRDKEIDLEKAEHFKYHETTISFTEAQMLVEYIYLLEENMQVYRDGAEEKDYLISLLINENKKLVRK